MLEQHRHDLIVDAGRKLDKAQMVRFDERTGYFASTDLGRIASHFYIKYDTVEVWFKIWSCKFTSTLVGPCEEPILQGI